MSMITGTSNISSNNKCEVIPQDGLVASYLLTGTAEDEIDNYDGTENCNTYEYDTERGVVGSFDGSNDYIDSGYKTSNSSNTYSISAWVKRNSTNTYDAIYAEVDYTNNSYGCLIMFRDDGVGISSGHFKHVDSDYDVVGGDISGIVNMTDWIHIVFTRENGVEHKLYIDGVLFNTLACANVSSASSFTGKIGHNPDYTGGDNRTFDGNISNLHIYNRALSDLEVNQIYNIEKDVHNIPIDNGLIAYYPLEGNSLDNAISPSYDGTDSGVSYVYDSEIGKVISSFDGVNDYILPSYSLSTDSNFSISMWLKSEETTLKLQGWYNGASANNRAYIKASKTSVAINFGTDKNDSASISVSDGNFNHIAITKLGNSYDLYINGILEISGYIGDYSSTFTDVVLGIGAMWRTDTNLAKSYNKCKVSNYRIYNRVLSQTEIEAIYEYEKPDSKVCLDKDSGVGQLP